MPTCEASAYLQMWDADAHLKPRGFDAAASLRLAGVAGACVLRGVGGGWLAGDGGSCA